MHRQLPSSPHSACILLAVALVAIGGCGQRDGQQSHGDQTGDDATAYLGRAALQAQRPPDPGVLVTPHDGSGGRPFRAVGRVALSGKPPFAQPILILDDGTVYQLTGPERGACIHRQGRRLDLTGTVIGESSSVGVRGVVRVTGFREVRP